MNGKIAKLFAMVMVLALVVSLSATGIVYDTESASAAGIMKWLKVPIPEQADFQLLPGSNLSAIAVTPSGDTLFAAVWNVSDDGEWHVMESTDGGFSWRDTGYNEQVYAGDPSDIVEIVVSPNWEMGVNFRYLYVATTDRVHRSSNAGNIFSTMAGDPTAGGEVITSLDVAFTDIGHEVLVGTYGVGLGPDVWLWNDAWIPQGANDNLMQLFGVLDVAFSPTYRDDDIIYCVVNTEPVLLQRQTMLRMATDPARTFGDVANWGGYVSDAKFYKGTSTTPIFCGDAATGAISLGGGLDGRARMAFAEDYDSSPGSATWSVFVGVSAYEPCGLCAGTCSTGDVFLVSIVTTFITASEVEDKNIRGGDSASNVWSIAVSGNTASATILAGMRELNIEGGTAALVSGVHYSTNGGTSWLQSYKPPSGLTKQTIALDCLNNINQAETYVIMAPDFQTSGMAYAATSGHFSGVWVSTTDGTTWNGRGLLDYKLYDIEDIEPSPRYATDNTIFMVTAMNTSFNPTGTLGILWQTEDSGGHWEVILAMNAMFPLPGINIDNVELAVNYPDDKYIFVTGKRVVQKLIAGDPDHCIKILGSADGGNTFTIPVGTDEFVITEFVALGGAEIIAAGWELSTGFNYVWRTEKTAYNWEKSDAFARDATVTDLEVYGKSVLVGTGPTEAKQAWPDNPGGWPAVNEGGQVYLCHDYLANFQQFLRMGSDPGTLGDEVFIAFDSDYYSNDIIYAGLNSSVSGGEGEVWRYKVGGTLPWEQISSAKDAPCPEHWGLFQADGITPVEFDVLDTDDPPGPNGSTPMNVLGLTCADDGTLYALDQILPTLDPAVVPPLVPTVGNGLTWRSADPLQEYVTLGAEPLFEPMGVGLGWPDNGRNLPVVYKDMEVVGGGSNYLFAIGRDGNDYPAIYSYYDTLTSQRTTGPVDLVRPEDGATGVGTMVDLNKVAVVLEWEEAPGATQYEWEVGRNEQFTTKVAHSTFLDKEPVANLQLTDAESLQGYLWPGDTFYWHVRVVQPYLSTWSETWSFDTTPESTGPKPSLVSPAAGATGTSRNPMLQWDIAVNADCYKVVVAKDCDWSSPAFQKETGAETVTKVTSTLAYNTNYCWKVTAYSGGCDGTMLGTSYGAFTTEEAPEEVVEEGTPFWVWLVIAIAAILLIAVIALIVLTKKS